MSTTRPSSTEPQVKYFEFLPVSLSLETLGGVSTQLIPRGTSLPCSKSETFTTASDDQESVEVKVLVGERVMARHNRVLTKFLLEKIPPAARGAAQVRVTFDVDNSCHISASAVDLTAKVAIQVVIEDSSSFFATEDLDAIVQEAEAHRVEDEARLLVREASLVSKSAGSFSIFGSDSTTRSRIERLSASLGVAIQNGRLDEIERIVKILRPQIDEAKRDAVNPFEALFSSASSHPAKTRAPSVDRRTSQQTKSQQSRPQSIPGQNLSEKLNNPLNIGRIFGGYSPNIDDKLCFVLMQFSNELNVVYTDHVKPVVESEGLTCKRADELFGVDSITRDIWQMICDAKVLVADLTGKNPNVFYELGLAHALGKSVVLLTQTMDDVPFDVKALRCIVYQVTPRGVKELETRLRATIRSIIEPT